MAPSPIPPKKKDNRKSSGAWGWRRREMEGFEVDNIGARGEGLHKMEGKDSSVNYGLDQGAFDWRYFIP